MSIVKKARQPTKARAESRKPKGGDPTAARAKAAKASAAKAAKAKAAEEKKARAAAEKAAKARAAEEKKAKAAAEKAAKARAAEEKKAKAAAAKVARARAAEEKKAKAAADRADRAAAKLALPKRRTARRRSPTVTSDEPITLESIEDQIREAYLRETRGAVKERVLLKDLRSKIGVQSQDFDQTLLAMQQQGKVVLMGLDNPLERTPDVEAAAIHIAGSPRYLVYFQA
jgi:hypothetical protein